MNIKRIKALFVSLTLTVMMIPLCTQTIITDAATVMKYDLGANAQSGWTGVSASQGYDKNKGYGFSSGSNVKNVSASGKDELSDAVQFTGNTTFNADLAIGLYRVKVTLGDTSRTSVYMENMIQIVNMTGNNAWVFNIF